MVLFAGFQGNASCKLKQAFEVRVEPGKQPACYCAGENARLPKMKCPDEMLSCFHPIALKQAKAPARKFSRGRPCMPAFLDRCALRLFKTQLWTIDLLEDEI